MAGLAVLAACAACQGQNNSAKNLRRFSGTSDSQKIVGDGWMPSVWQRFKVYGPTGGHLPDFSHAGFKMGRQPIPQVRGPVFSVTDKAFGAVADDGIDDTAAIQSAIEAAGAAGGGVVWIPKGRYEIRKTADAPFLRITHSHVILRGQGSDASGSILHLGSPAPAQAVRRLGSVAAIEDARHRTTVAVMGPEVKHELAAYTADVLRGQREIPVADSSHLSPGQPVFIAYRDPLIDAQHPHPRQVDLAAQLTHPFQLTERQTDTIGKAAQHMSWIVKIDAIPGPTSIRLAKPARFNQWLRYQPRIYSFGGLHGVGIEDLRFESRWPGGYRHHKPYVAAGGNILRSAKEQDYLWGGIWFSYAYNSWVQNVTFKDLTQGVIVSHCADMTIRNVQFKGHDGHAGITIGQSNGILVKGAQFFSKLVHPVTLTMMASGNVITDSEAYYEGRNPLSGTDAVIDFHGLFPHENLFENMRGFYVCPGGDLSVLPHGGVRNVFWNIQAPQQMECYTDKASNEFMRTYDLKSTSSQTQQTMFEHLPQAFYIGLHRKGERPVTIGGQSGDRQNRWMTVEGINRSDIAIPSLYEAQRSYRAD
jgi:hypothetical protein